MTDRQENTLIPPLEALRCLLDDLNTQGIRYCQWKSNIRLEQSLRGGTDLDLLIDPQDMAAFAKTLQAHKVKHFRATPGKEYPCISNYLGYDPGSGRLYHLHVHEALVLGEQFVKNYRLPLEQAFLDDTRLQFGVRTPRPEVEIIVFVLRALLKYRDRDALKEIVRSRLRGQHNGTGGLPQPVLREARWLLSQTSLASIEEQLQAWQASIPGPVVLEFLRELQAQQLSGLALVRMRGQLRQALQAHQRSSRALVALRYFREDWRRKRRIFRPRHAKKMTREQGGLRVAVIGPDGAGKSTIIQQIEDWLSWRLSVETFYMGKSKSLAITRLVKAITHQARRVSAFSCRKLGSSSPAARLARQNQRFWEDTSFLAEGWERVRRYRYSMNEAAAGVVILYDRYPLEGVQVFGQPVDGPRIIARRSGSVSWLERRFAAVEESLYRQILAPEQLIALHVSPEISQARKPEHGLEMVTGKALALDEASLVLPGVSIVQADEPLPQVVAQVKSILWDSL